MKVIILTKKDNGDYAIDIIADSALQKTGKPFFIPEFAKNFQAKPMIAALIHRLGKNIAAKFADRYYEEVGVCLSITATDMLKEIKDAGEPWAKATAFDGSTIVGNFFDKQELGSETVLTITSGKGSAEIALTDIFDNFNKAIEYAGKFFTLKIGDIILLDAKAEPVDLAINDKINCSINTKNSIEIKIK